MAVVPAKGETEIDRSPVDSGPVERQHMDVLAGPMAKHGKRSQRGPGRFPAGWPPYRSSSTSISQLRNAESSEGSA